MQDGSENQEILNVIWVEFLDSDKYNVGSNMQREKKI